ncbi:hypothetical protein ABGB18_31340 [Nonomuraea sp. B12E4]|uniref:hypothetical protein n=1 Tax=Nonomuraea sp. B12E4 TaxID=3153564 RepID=UPI00325EBDCF
MVLRFNRNGAQPLRRGGVRGTGDLQIANSAALELADLDAEWAAQATTLIHAGLFEHLTTEANR